MAPWRMHCWEQGQAREAQVGCFAVVQVRGDDSSDGVTFLGCSVKGEKWL